MVKANHALSNSAQVFIFTNRIIFGKEVYFIYVFLSIYANQSHNFTNLTFGDVTLLISVITLIW